MRIVTYARVSTKGQKDRGTSLEDQEKRFSEWLERSGHTRVRAYSEAMSGGKNMQEATFKNMLEDLPALRVDCLVVDSLDRFTRDKLAGAAMTQQLGETGVKLWELEYSDTEPFDLGVDEHRDWVMQRFSDAEAERRRIKKRQLKRYKEQRERGAATTNRPAYGLLLEGKDRGKKRIVPDPETAPIVVETDRRILAGQSQNKVLEWLREFPGAWRSRRGLTIALNDEHGAYIGAGVRTEDVQYQLRQLLGKRRQAFGEDRSTRSVRRHELSGLVACYKCVQAGLAPEQALMHGRYVQRNPNPYTLVCSGRMHEGVKTHTKEFYASEHKVRALVVEKLIRLRDAKVASAVLERWAREPQSDKVAKLRRSLERQLASFDDQEAALEKRVAYAFDLAADGGPGAAEAKRLIVRAEQDRMGLAAQRAALSQKLAQVPVSRSKVYDVQDLQFDAERLFDPIVDPSAAVEAHINASGKLEITGTYFASIREPFAKWVKAIGPPLLERQERRVWRPQLKLHWAFLDKLPFRRERREYDADADPRDWPDGAYDAAEAYASGQ